MENASKALIIAGAILISILLIGFGVAIVGGGQGLFESAGIQMSEQEQQVFNSKFTQYEGEKVKGANVRALIRNIISSNSANQDIDGKLVTLDVSKAYTNGTTITPEAGATKANEMSAASSKINTGATYLVTIEYNNDTGLVNKVIVSKN